MNNFFGTNTAIDELLIILLNSYYSNITLLFNSFCSFLNVNRINVLQYIYFNLIKINNLIEIAKNNGHFQNNLSNNFILNSIQIFHFKMLKDMIVNLGTDNAYLLFEEVKLAFQLNNTTNTGYSI